MSVVLDVSIGTLDCWWPKRRKMWDMTGKTRYSRRWAAYNNCWRQLGSSVAYPYIEVCVQFTGLWVRVLVINGTVAPSLPISDLSATLVNASRRRDYLRFGRFMSGTDAWNHQSALSCRSRPSTCMVNNILGLLIHYRQSSPNQAGSLT